MATYDDESDSYMYSYNPYSYRYLNPKPKGLSWRQKSYLSSYGDSGEYFDNYQRAHLKSILSQINPDLTPRLRKANTKDVGIQVNPKTDASVQCSLGPRTLVASKREALRWRRPTSPITGSPVNNLAKTVRFPRTLALYSPIAARRPPSFLEEKYDREKPEGDPPETTEKVQVQDDDTKSTLEEKEASPAYDKASMKTDTGSGVGAAQKNKSGGDQKEGQDDNRSRARVRFQFLEQKYGYYHCRECNLRWESAYVWCVQGTNKVYFKQFCRTCQKAFNPYRVEDITCQATRPIGLEDNTDLMAPLQNHRTLALYSPIAARRPPSFLEEKYDREKPEGDPPETTEKVQVQDDDTKSTLEEKEASPAYDKASMKTDTGSGVGAAQKNKSGGDQKEGQDDNRSRARVRFQFLEQKYGYYHCRECNLRWESAYVWCVQGTNKVYFKQFCRTCQKAFNPYRVEDITCQHQTVGQKSTASNWSVCEIDN
ncbi:UNVERIFIED_CONTAM: hypothetical protein FKN15_019279 [Acipenser sinensis]